MSPPSRSVGHERDLREQRHAELVGELLATAGAEELVARAVVAGEPRHVLDHADHVEVDLLRHRRRALRDALRRGLRRGDDDHLGAREELRDRQRDVAGARRHVDDEVVELAPVRRR